MSTRTNIHFNHGGHVYANIYRHSDGYPGKVKDGKEIEYGVLSDLLTFFRKLKAEVPDHRMGEPEYLAAKFLVWQADQNAYYETYGKGEDGEYGFDESRKHPLRFLSVAPCIKDHGDIEYVYEIDCDKSDTEGFPVIRWKPTIPFGGSEVQKGRWRTVYLCGKPAKVA